MRRIVNIKEIIAAAAVAVVIFYLINPADFPDNVAMYVSGLISAWLFGKPQR